MTTPVPEDFHTITPQLAVKGVADAIAWYAKALGAHELLRNTAPDGERIMHAELLLGDSRFFVVDEFPESMASPASLGGTSVTLHLYVRDVDTLFNRHRPVQPSMPVAGPVLGRSLGSARPLRTSLVDGQPHRGPFTEAAGPGQSLGRRSGRRHDLRARRSHRLRRVSALERLRRRDSRLHPRG
jgi:PhnB protein